MVNSAISLLRPKPKLVLINICHIQSLGLFIISVVSFFLNSLLYVQSTPVTATQTLFIRSVSPIPHMPSVLAVKTAPVLGELPSSAGSHLDQ